MWNRLNVFPKVIDAFRYLSFPHENISNNVFNLLQHFFILCYSSTSHLDSVNDVRNELSTFFNRTKLNIPLTAAALMEHSLRSRYQGGHVWVRPWCPT